MRYVKLEEICFKGVSSLRQKDTLPVGDYPVYGASGICGYLSGYQHNEPYVAVVKDGAGVGRVQLCSGKSSVLGTLQALLPKDEVSCEYLYEVVRSLELGAGFTGSTIPHIYFKDYKNRTVVIYEKEQQTKITTLFTTLKNVVELHKCAISFYDELVKSRFVEMFGDPIENPKKWEIKQLEDVYEIIDGDRGKNYPKSSEFSETGFCLFLNAGNVTKQGFDFSSTQFITKEKDSLLRKGKLKRHDLVVTTRGTVGNIAYYDDYVPYENMRINSGMVILRAKKEIAKEYFVSFFRNPAIYNSLISGTAQPQMPIRSMKNTKMMLPPLFLQQEFAAFVHQVDKLKFDFDFLVSFSIPSICLFCLKLDP